MGFSAVWLLRDIGRGRGLGGVASLFYTVASMSFRLVVVVAAAVVVAVATADAAARVFSARLSSSRHVPSFAWRVRAEG